MAMTNMIEWLHTTVAYQAAVLRLLTNDANALAPRLGLLESPPLPVVSYDIARPPAGTGGGFSTSNYVFLYNQGQLRWLQKQSRLPAGLTNLAQAVLPPGRTNSQDIPAALRQARRWLDLAGVDLEKLESLARAETMRVTMRAPAPPDSSGPLLPTSIFVVSWREPEKEFSIFPLARVTLIPGELLELSLRDAVLFRHPPFALTNAAELLGPLPERETFVTRLLGGPEAREILENPDRLAVDLVHDRSDEAGTRVETRRRGPPPARRTIDAFRRILLDFESYEWEATKLCSPSYGVRLAFERADRKLEVLLCLKCDILAIRFDGQERTENFDPARGELLRLAHRLFPDDPELQRLRDKP